MSPCNFIDLGNGASAIVCTRGSVSQKVNSRCACGRVANLLCDYPLKGPKAGKTCDRPLCMLCAIRVSVGKDYCPAHARAEGIAK